MSKKKSKSHASQSLLSDASESREIFFTNLLLLGFEQLESERRHNIPFNRDMFALPNKKAFEVVMHFLFERLNSTMAYEMFSYCWPICDKKQEQLFRRAISNKLTEISAEDPLANLPRIVPSLFMSPGGDRFYSLLLHFSQYVLLKVVRQENGKKERDILQRPKLLPAVSHLGHIMLKTLQAASIRHRKRFMDTAQLMVLLHMEWKQFADKLVKEHRSLNKQVRDLERDIRDCQAASYDQAQARGSPVTARRRSGCMTSGELQLQAVKRTQKIQKVRELWKAVDALYVSQSAERDVVASVLQAAENKYQLDAGEINVQVPELLLRECQQELQRRNVGNTYEAGKLSLVALIQLWNLSLHLYLETVQQAPMPRFEDLSPDLVTQVHTHHAHLANTQTMRSTLTNELIPELKASVSCLHKQVVEGKTPSRKNTRRSFQLSSLGLELLPPTPPVSFEPAAGLQYETPTRLPAPASLRNNTSTDTPEAVSMLSDTINKAALRHAGLAQGTPISTHRELRKPTHGHSKLPVPTNTTLPDAMLNRKRVKSAPSKVPPATPRAQTHPFHPDLQDTHAQAPRASTQLKGSVNKDFTQMAKTQPRKGTQSRLSKDSRATRKEQGSAQTHSMRKKTSKTKKPAVDGTPASLSRTPVATPRTNQMSSAARSKTAPRAHQILAEQIVDAVTKGGRITPDFLDILKAHSRENSPLDLALQDPLANLDQGAFVSKDKLMRTPVSEEKSVDASRLTDTPHQTMPTRTLFQSDSSPEDASGQVLFTPPPDASSLLLNDSSEESHLPNDEVPVGNLLDFEEPSDQGGLHLFPRQHQDSIGKAEESPEAHFDPQRLVTVGDDSPQPETRGEFSENLDQTLAEIFQTRTPQLSTRAKTRLAARTQGTSLPSFREVDETSGTPSLPNRERNLTEDLTPDLNMLRQNRIKRQNESSKIPQMQEPFNLSQKQNGLAPNSSTKARQVSGGSQKSVTFSEHIDEHSFLDEDLTTPDRSSDELQSRKEPSPLREPTDNFEQTAPHESFDQETPRLLDSPREGTGSFLSDAYLALSPPPPEGPSQNLSASPLESQLLSDSDLGQDLSMNLSTAIDDLLVPISPEVTPSRTPKLITRHTSLGSANSSYLKGTPAFKEPAEYGSFRESLPFRTDDLLGLTSETSLLEGFSNLQLSGIKASKTSTTPSCKTIEMPMNFDLFDEDDSILLPTSPALRQGMLVDINSPSF